MATSRSPLTVISVFLLCFVAVSLALTGDEEARAVDDVALARSMRSARWMPFTLFGNERAVVHRRSRRQRGAGSLPIFSRRARFLLSRLATASATFSMQMYNFLRQDHPELAFSPYSIHSALTMTYMGARDSTAKQMNKVLRLRRLRRNRAHQAYAALINSLADSGHVTLRVANGVYVKPNRTILQSFRAGVHSMYSAQVGQLDLETEGGPEAPINAFVAFETGNKIQDLLSPGLINNMTSLVLVNAIYFKGDWQDPFNENSTTEQPFYRGDGSTTQVHMMARTADYQYTEARDLSAHIVQLPYQDGRFSMYVVLPTSRNGLATTERSLTWDRLNRHLSNMTATRVALHLPRFKTESKFSLKETLQMMGMILPFSRNRARFTGISYISDLYISEVIHQAVIEVSEEGTEAAAATDVIIGLRSSRRNAVEVRADHPFFYAIRDNESNSLLFMGKYSAQEQESE